MSNNKGLGRGLEALFGVYADNDNYKNITNKNESNGVLEIDINKIKPNPNQPRKNFDQEALNELASSIKIHGIVQPIVLNKQANGEYLIIAGERRWRAANICGLKTVPAVVYPVKAGIFAVHAQEFFDVIMHTLIQRFSQ